jgi:Fe-S-cluster containining protein
MTTGATRKIVHRYDDPLDLVWRRCAARCGFEILRTNEVYASYDGTRTLRLSTPDDFDADDSLAQLILHELCHALVALARRPDALKIEDYGLDNTSDKDLVDEHATHRLQAHLADRWGLRPLFAVTTTWRPYWDRLGKNALRGPESDPAVPLAKAAFDLAETEPWATAFRQAFAETATIADLARPHAAPDSLWSLCDERVHRRHPLGPRLGPSDERCGTCAWSNSGRCLMLGARPIDETMPSCLHWEPRLTADRCGDCGACCHRAFHLVPVGEDEPIVVRHPHLVTRDAAPGLGAGHFFIARPDGFCQALSAPRAPFRCSVYEDRPESCRDFTLGSENCLEARRRVGLSPRP